MTVYAFEDCASGEPLELDFPMAEVPRIGEEFLLDDGRRVRRTASLDWQRSPEKDCRHSAFSFQKGHPGAPHYDEKGYPAFTNKRQIEDFGKRYGYVYD